MPSGKGNLRKIALSYNKSALKKISSLYYIVIVIVDGEFAAYAIKMYHNCRKDEQLVRLLRSYAKQISIKAIKKIGAPLLGLAKYIYIIFRVSLKFLAHLFVRFSLREFKRNSSIEMIMNNQTSNHFCVRWHTKRIKFEFDQYFLYLLQ